MTTEEIKTPWIIHVLEVVAWVTVAISVLCFLFGLAAEDQRYLIGGGFAGALSGLFLLAGCLGLRKLTQIENHLSALKASLWRIESSKDTKGTE